MRMSAPPNRDSTERTAWPDQPRGKKYPQPQGEARRNQPQRRARAGGDRALSLGVLDGQFGYFLRRVQVRVFKDFIETSDTIHFC
jgi:hypothetical protein